MVSTVDETGVTSTFSGDVRIEFANFSISGGMVAEKKKCLPLVGNQFQYALYIMYKAHIQHTVCFIKHKIIEPFKGNISLRLQVEQTSRSSNQYLYSPFQCIYLWFRRNSSKNYRMLYACIPGIRIKALAYLNGQFSRGSKYQCLDTFLTI